jgi:hypothetical protein
MTHHDAPLRDLNPSSQAKTPGASSVALLCDIRLVPADRHQPLERDGPVLAAWPGLHRRAGCLRQRSVAYPLEHARRTSAWGSSSLAALNKPAT